MEISNFEGLSLSKSFEEMSLPNIIDIFNKFKASAMDDDNCEILQSGSFSKLKPFNFPHASTKYSEIQAR